MRKLVVNEFMSLDGVVQAPGAEDEDSSGGFRHGGWHLRYFDELSQKWVLEGLTAAGGFVFGRRTYETFAAYWPNASADEQVIAQPLNTLPKYVASRTLSEPLAWQNSTLIEHDLVDELRVMIDPLMLGGGKRIFRDDGVLRPLRLVDSQVTTTGSVI